MNAKRCIPAAMALAAAMLLCAHTACPAQPAIPDTAKSRPQKIDTSRVPPKPPDTARARKNSPPELKMSRSPLVAVLLSIVPGGGQLYNGQYWKAPLFLGVAVFFAWRAVYYHGQFTSKVDQLAALSPGDSNAIPGLKYQREFYRDNRDANIAYYLGATIISMIDAYVGANLFDFDVSDDVSAQIRLDPLNRAVNLRVRF